jgi:hypothetical protein
MLSSKAVAQENALIGREFYFAAWPNLGNPNDQITLVLFAYGTGTATVAGTNYPVTNGGRITLTFPLSNYVGTSSLKITSDVDLVAYAGILGEYIGYGSADATAILPTQSLGTEYRIFQYKMLSAGSGTGNSTQTYRVIATAPQTSVYENGVLVATLANAGDVYVSNTAWQTDRTGTRITSNKPVAVFSGNCGSAYLASADDILVEQMWPIPTWGKEYILSRLGSVQNNCRILSDESTDVTVTVKIGNNAATTKTVPAGSYAEFQFNDLTQITSNVPIAVAQYTTGIDDPSMMWVNPVDQRVTTAQLARLKDTWTSYVTILTREQDFDNTTFTVNGVSKSFTSTITYTGIPGWKAGRYQLQSGENWVYAFNQNGLTAMIEGYGNNRSYIYAAAGGTLNLQNYFTIGTKTLPYNDVHYSATVEATHTFVPTDTITVKRTLERPFTQVSWLVHGAAYTGVTENTNAINTLSIPASALHCGKDSITMSVRYSGASVDSLYTGYVWIDNPASGADINVSGNLSLCAGSSAILTASSTTVTNPTFRWYASQIATEALHIGASYETPTLTATATFYVSVSGNGVCENEQGERKAATVTVSPCVVPVNPHLRTRVN